MTSVREGPLLVDPRQYGSQDPPKRRRCDDRRGALHNFIVGRDATNDSPNCSLLSPKQRSQPHLSGDALSRKRCASRSLERVRGQGGIGVRSSSAPVHAVSPLRTPLGTSTSRNSNTSNSNGHHRQSTCITGLFNCPTAGWKIEEYCEACHG